MSAAEWGFLFGVGVGLVIGAVVGAVAWHRAGRADREQDLAERYKLGISVGRVEGRSAGFADAVEVQRQKDSARATKAARTREAKRGAK